MKLYMEIINIVGYIGTIWLIISGLIILIGWLKGIWTPVWRLGNGLARRRIAVFAKGDNQESFKNLLLDSSLFNSKNVISITKKEDLGRAEKSTLYLVVWADFGEEITNILNKKRDDTALIIFAEHGKVSPDECKILDEHRNVTLVNFKGRLLNDILISLMATGYEKR